MVGPRILICQNPFCKLPISRKIDEEREEKEEEKSQRISLAFIFGKGRHQDRRPKGRNELDLRYAGFLMTWARYRLAYIEIYRGSPHAGSNADGVYRHGATNCGLKTPTINVNNKHVMPKLLVNRHQLPMPVDDADFQYKLSKPTEDGL